jgi:hypothetical protein
MAGPSSRDGAAWRAARFTLVRSLRAILPAALVGVPASFWAVDGTHRASLSPLGRDQGIFQYVAWAMLHGAKDYRDIRDVNGPLTHFVHMAFLLLGGRDEHRFRLLDLVVTGASFALVGACLTGVGRRGRSRPELLERVAWGGAAWVVFMAQYLAYLYWDLAQRESFFDWFMLSSVAVQIAAQSPGAREGRARWMLALAGFASVAPWFGKPTYALFTLAQLVALVADREGPVSLRRRFVTFGAGGACAAVLLTACLAAYGDIGAYLGFLLRDIPRVYRFIWAHSASEIFANTWFGAQALLALVGAMTIVGLIFAGQLPARTLTVALVPVIGLVSVVLQAKGFPYHFHPVTAGVALQWMTLVIVAWERAWALPRQRGLVRALPFVLSSALALKVGAMLQESPHVKAVWLLWKGVTPEQRESQAYFAGFPEPDFFPYEMRQTAAYLRQHTRPTARVQTYGMDPYVLFLAERMSATPYIYAYDLDVDAALAGGLGASPDAQQAERIRALRRDHEVDLLARLEAAPPAAFVFFDKSPLMTSDDAWQDFKDHCPDASAWVDRHYEESASFGKDRVWLRRDLDLDAAEGAGRR